MSQGNGLAMEAGCIEHFRFVSPPFNGNAYKPAFFMCKNAEAIGDLVTSARYGEGDEMPQDIHDHFAAELRLAEYLRTGK